MRAAPIAALLALAACSSVKVSTDYDPSADFASLKTWDWFPGTPAGADDLAHGRIKAAVEASLASRGWRRSAEKPDFLLAARASLRERIEVSPSTVTVGYGWRRGYVGAASSPDVRTYEEGTLALDVVHPGAKNLLWRGVARGAVDPGASPEERQERIRNAVEKILNEFPPGR